MQLLVCGLNRSGTSAVSHLIAKAAGVSLLDDPDWAISAPRMGLAYRSDERLRAALDSHTILKCPRMTEVLTDVRADFPELGVVCAIRDPRDVFASIQEKVLLGRPTRMLDNARFGPHDTPLDGFVAQANTYFATAARAADAGALVIDYDRFFFDRAATIHVALRWLGWQEERALKESEFHDQYGPVGHKRSPNTIDGPGRHQRDLPREVAESIWTRCEDAYAAARAAASYAECV
jgi:hypothetical protein